MILEWFVDFVLSLLGAVMDLIPDVTLDLGSFAGVFGVIGAFNAVIPLDTMLQGSLVVLTVTGFMFVLKVLQTLLAHIPWIGGGGA